MRQYIYAFGGCLSAGYGVRSRPADRYGGAIIETRAVLNPAQAPRQGSGRFPDENKALGQPGGSRYRRAARRGRRAENRGRAARLAGRFRQTSQNSAGGSEARAAAHSSPIFGR